MKRSFNLKLKAKYKLENNEIEELSILIYEDGKWQDLELNNHSPGFLLFINGLFSCQHLYMRTNCAERNIVLESAIGELKVEANENWQVQTAKVFFEAKVKSGTVSDDDYAYISERMFYCPVSANLPKELKLTNNLIFK